MQIHRRELMLGGAAVAFAAVPFRLSASTIDQRPNILWLVSEDNNPFIGAYGDKLARTPAIDQLASRGVLYRNAFSTAPVCAPSRFSIITGASAESNAPANHMRAVSQLPRGWRTTPEFMRAAGYYCTNNSKTDYNCAIDPKAIWNDSSASAHWKNRPHGSPFFSVFNFMTTHESMLFDAPAGRVKPGEVTVPPNLPDTPQVRADIAAYYNLMEKMDGEVAAQLAALEKAGLADDTIVFYYADNGGVLPTTKRYCSDAGLRVPLIAYYPPKWSHLAPGTAGSEIAAPVTLMDLPSTILRLAGQTQPRQMVGRPLTKGVPLPRFAFGMRNRMDERYDFVRSVTDGRWRYTRNYMPHLPSGQYGAFEWLAKGYQSLETEYRAGRLNRAQSRFFEQRPFEELYDLDTDPDELNNVAGQRRAAAKLAELRSALDQHMLSINDNGFIPEGSALEGFNPSRAPGAYPLRRLMEIGARAALRNPENVPRFVAGLNDRNEVVRYWNAMGLMMLGKAAAAATPALRRRYGIESSPQVRVALAEALGYAGAIEQARPLLISVLDRDPSPRVKLQALNALTHLQASDAESIAAAERAQASKDEYISRAARYHVLMFTGQYRPDAKIYGGFGGAPR